MACFKTSTTEETHRIIRENMHRSVHVRETVKGTYTLILVPVPLHPLVQAALFDHSDSSVNLL